ncbi:MAG: hypothetical protein LRY55_08765 [Leadbetterella sp.]|nr:hypothetical protein [Leadbetterella sp.]
MNFGKEIYIEVSDFMEDAPAKYFRLKPGGLVRLKGAYIIQCDEVVKTDDGRISELRCSFIENSKSGEDVSGLKVKGVIHWVNAQEAVEAEVRLYDRLFKVENPAAEEGDFKAFINENSLTVVKALVEPSLRHASVSDKYQFIRNGYFVLDAESKPPHTLIFNKTVGLKDSWK